MEDSLSNSAILATLLLMGACALVVWVVQVFAGKRVLGYALLGLGVLVLPCIQNMWRTDFLVPRLTPLPALPVTSVTATNLPVPGTGSQLLWSAFAVAGLPTNGIVVAESGGPTFNPNGTNKTYHLGGFRNYAFSQIMTPNGLELNRLRPIESGQQEAYVALLHAFFPPETLWTDLPVNNWSGFTGMDEVYKETAARPIRGGLYWSAEFDQFKVFPALRVALRPGVWTLAPGSRLVIHSVSPGPNSITVTVEEISATPPLLPSVYGGLHNVYPSHSRCTYVLYHPDGGQAELLGNQLYSFVPADFLGGESHQYNRFEIAYPVLPARLLGVSWQEYLDKAVLCVFLPVYQGTFHQTYQENNFDLARVQGQSAAAGDDQKSQATLQSLTLPTAPTAAQIGDYLDHLLQALPDNSDAATRKLIQSRLAAIGTAGVPLLLDRLPWERNAEMFYLFPYLTTYATRDQLPDLRAALARDLNLADWFKKMKWDDAARETLVSRLSDHRQVFPPVALELAAGARNPATYADLKWHFVRLEYQQQAVATALAECPGFDLNGAIREAWQRVLLGLNPPGDLPFLAAKLGLPDAFNQAVIQVESRANLSQQAKDRIQQLAALTEFPGPPDAAQAWLSARLGRFQYEPATGRYRLNGGGP
jgi:hypothetical protein